MCISLWQTYSWTDLFPRLNTKLHCDYQIPVEYSWQGLRVPLCLLNKTKSLCVSAVLHWDYSSLNIRIEWKMFAVAWYCQGWMKECWNFTSHKSCILDEDLVAGCVVVSVPGMALRLHTGPELRNTSVTNTNQGILMIDIMTKWSLMIKKNLPISLLNMIH